MKLAIAEDYAAKVLTWIEPYVVRARVAGSIRRRCAEPRDIDIVCIPRMHEVKDLLGKVVAEENRLLHFLMNYVDESGGAAEWLQCAGQSPSQFLLKLRGGEQLDLWLADEANFATRFLCRTGSKEHNIFLCEQARRIGRKWSPTRGVFDGEKLLPAKSEEEIFGQLKLDYVEPENRSCGRPQNRAQFHPDLEE